jgi:actin-related protein 8
VIRQTSQAKARLEKETAEAELAKLVEEGETAPAPVSPLAASCMARVQANWQTNPLHNILIIHPGSRNLRIGRASDYYPKEVPNCIARPSNAPNRGTDPPVPGSRVKRLAARAEEQRAAKRQRLEQGAADGADGNAAADVLEGEDLTEWENPVDSHITTLREYLKEHLRLRRLSTNFDEVRRVRAANAKVKPDSIPEHNDPFRIDWTETKGRDFFVGHEVS